MNTSIWNKKSIFEPFAQSVVCSEDCFGTTAMLELTNATLTISQFRAKFPNYNFGESERVDGLVITKVIRVWL